MDTAATDTAPSLLWQQQRTVRIQVADLSIPERSRSSARRPRRCDAALPPHDRGSGGSLDGHSTRRFLRRLRRRLRQTQRRGGRPVSALTLTLTALALVRNDARNGCVPACELRLAYRQRVRFAMRILVRITNASRS